MSTHQSFAALRNPGFRIFFVGNALAMLADNMEHVISYWVMYQEFHSAALGAFAVISHWLPFLLFSVPVGVLADRVDPRRLIQLGMGLFMLVSLAWGMLFATNTLQVWHAMVLLVLHGVAGVFWSTPTMLLLHDIVDTKDLQSAVRSNASARYIGTMLGPAVGSAMMLLLAPHWAMLINTLIYLPLFIWLIKAPYGPKFRSYHKASPPFRGFADVFATVRSLGGNHTLVAMLLLSALASFLVGNAYQAQMPGFAAMLGNGDPGIAYSILLAADAAGALSAGLLLESRGLLKPQAATAFLLAGLWCLCLAGFALSKIYPLAILLLFVAGFLELAFGAMTQTLVQLNAPEKIRGRVIGLFGMAASGMRMFSGFTVGLMGDFFGIRASLSLSAVVLMFSLFALYRWSIRPSTRNGLNL